mgnify:CR=1 FL=1
MELSEIFLISWATIATILAVGFHTVAKRAVKQLAMFQFAMVEIANKNAELYIDGQSIKIKEI